MGATAATFTVSLGNPSAFPVSVDVTTQDGTAGAPGDYAATATSLVFLPGETSHTVDILVNGDTVFEGNETLTVELSNEAGATTVDRDRAGDDRRRRRRADDQRRRRRSP